MTAKLAIVTESGVEIDVPLNRLRKSPKNARKVPHGEAAIEALAGSIGAKRMLQPLIVEPEIAEGGEPTGCYLVTIGEGRRLAQLLRAKRGEIKKTHPIRCVVEVSLDGQEISLDENVTRTAMHPADQFEAFRDQAERRGFGPEEIAARFGVSPQLVRQRLRLGAVSPKLLAVYREDGLTLVHLAVRVLGDDGRRLNPKKADLAAWREEFARALRDRGVDAEATPRRARGVTRKPERSAVRKIGERNAAGRGPMADVRQGAYRDAARAAFQDGAAPTSWEVHTLRRQGQVRDLYLAQAALLMTSADEADRNLGRAIERFVNTMPAPDTQRLALARELREANQALQPVRPADRDREARSR
jgi:ParB-like chromosome segregation protein Spo0J